MHEETFQELLLVQQGQSTTFDCNSYTNIALSKLTAMHGRPLKTVSGACYLQLHWQQEQHQVCMGRRSLTACCSADIHMPCEKGSIQTSDTVWQASGDSEWWRLREAALLAVGAVAKPILEVQAQQAQPALDIPALLHNVLHQDLIAPNAPPFLTGRALWMAARYCSPLTS